MYLETQTGLRVQDIVGFCAGVVRPCVGGTHIHHLPRNNPWSFSSYVISMCPDTRRSPSSGISRDTCPQQWARLQSEKGCQALGGRVGPKIFGKLKARVRAPTWLRSFSSGAMSTCHGLTHGSMAALPDEMFRFVVDAGSHAMPAPRVGQLLARGRKPISTPHYAPPTSRGVVPHVSPDMLEKHTAISALYIGLEDCKHSLRDSSHC